METVKKIPERFAFKRNMKEVLASFLTLKKTAPIRYQVRNNVGARGKEEEVNSKTMEDLRSANVMLLLLDIFAALKKTSPGLKSIFARTI